MYKTFKKTYNSNVSIPYLYHLVFIRLKGVNIFDTYWHCGFFSQAIIHWSSYRFLTPPPPRAFDKSPPTNSTSGNVHPKMISFLHIQWCNNTNRFWCSNKYISIGIYYLPHNNLDLYRKNRTVNNNDLSVHFSGNRHPHCMSPDFHVVFLHAVVDCLLEMVWARGRRKEILVTPYSEIGTSFSLQVYLCSFINLLFLHWNISLVILEKCSYLIITVAIA